MEHSGRSEKTLWRKLLGLRLILAIVVTNVIAFGWLAFINEYGKDWPLWAVAILNSPPIIAGVLSFFAINAALHDLVECWIPNERLKASLLKVRGDKTAAEYNLAASDEKMVAWLFLAPFMLIASLGAIALLLGAFVGGIAAYFSALSDLQASTPPWAIVIIVLLIVILQKK